MVFVQILCIFGYTYATEAIVSKDTYQDWIHFVLLDGLYMIYTHTL